MTKQGASPLFGHLIEDLESGKANPHEVRFARRRCYRLVCASQNLEPIGNSWLRQQRLEGRLGDDRSRPKGMHGAPTLVEPRVCPLPLLLGDADLSSRLHTRCTIYQGQAMHDERMRAAAELTARQLAQAIEIVEDEFGADLDNKHAPLLAAVLSALAANYRDGSVSERRRARPRPV